MYSSCSCYKIEDLFFLLASLNFLFNSNKMCIGSSYLVFHKYKYEVMYAQDGENTLGISVISSKNLVLKSIHLYFEYVPEV